MPSSNSNSSTRAIALVFVCIIFAVLLTSTARPQQLSSSSPRTTTALDADADSNASSSPSLAIPLAIPLASRRKRAATWRRVQKVVDVEASVKIMQEHRDVCSDATKSTFAPLRQGADFRIALLNFGGVGDAAAPSAGYHRLFVAILVRRDDNSNVFRRMCGVNATGAVLEASLASDRDKIDVDFAIEVEAGGAVPGGLYEFQPLFRRSGVYEFCASLNSINPSFAWRSTLRNMFGNGGGGGDGGGSTFRNNNIAEFIALGDPNAASGGSPGFCIHQSWTARQCVTRRISLTPSSEVALARRLTALRGGKPCNTRAALGRAFRSGAWMKIERCDGDLCVGASPAEAFPNPQSAPSQNATTAAAMTNTRSGGGNVGDGKSRWVFVSDTCTVRLYSMHDAWRVVDRHWMLLWGGSTLKQPVANFVEYVLGVPVFAASMETFQMIPARLRPNFHSYRKYDIVRSEPAALLRQQQEQPRQRQLRVTYAWGGCPKLTLPPTRCTSTMGMANRASMEHTLRSVGGGGGNSSSASSPSMMPTVIFLNHFIWRFPKYDEAAFMRQLDDTIQWLADRVTAASCRRRQQQQQKQAEEESKNTVELERPTLVWIGPVRRLYDDFESTRCQSEAVLTFERRISWRIEKYFDEYRAGKHPRPKTSKPCHGRQPFRDVVFLARHELVTALHTGSEHGHFRSHFGSTRGMCLTGTSHRNFYDLAKCVRNATGDWMMMQQWLNVMDV